MDINLYDAGDIGMSLFTIITVCYNTENDIQRTIESVRNQSYGDYEYLIVDGASKDKTVAIAESYRETFREKGVQYRISSEKDTGIYNAMNKGADMANGKWLLFLNAGDYLADAQVLEQVRKYDCDDAAMLYGDVIYKICGLYKRIPARELDLLKYGMVFSHQSVFIRKSVMTEYRYNESLQIGADYDFISRCYNSKEKMIHIPVTISVFELGGTSSIPMNHMLEELYIQKENGFISEQEYIEKTAHWKRKEKFYNARSKIENALPSSLVFFLRKRKYEKMGYTRADKM